MDFLVVLLGHRVAIFVVGVAEVDSYAYVGECFVVGEADEALSVVCSAYACSCGIERADECEEAVLLQFRS